MMMSTLSLGDSAFAPRLSATALATPASNKKDSSSTTAQLGVAPLAPQALTNDVFAPSVSLKMPADAPANASAATVETPDAKGKKTAPQKVEAVETKPTTEAKPVGKADNEASPEKIEQAKTIMAETGTKFSAEKDPAKAKKLLNDTYAQLKALNLPKENLIVHAMQLDVWDAAIVNLLPANDKPVSAVSVSAPATASAEKQTSTTKEASKEKAPSVNLLA